ncbi:peptide chain release factor N(5)-glutamine methyltransferase [Brevibacterium sp. S22]|uniref:peptide chain release factor N(5)-glutamine methyltransferase n=1 Tax=Brevibacterium sp. S22 TaxID=2483794 RepID=UPI0010926C48|nr:peptide chain release factor N(5)-glutamine methyltransferase [Brevibacterium sp. S22]TGD32973.1 peptide chain release factor N(5)-glutamine methyltransferase [Brevibacterium sp. S22]
MDTVRPTLVSEILRGAINLLSDAGIATPEADAVELLAHAWEVDRSALSRRRLFDDPVPVDVSRRFAELCDLRRQRIPLQHLTGIAHFRHLQLKVGPGVFVPRPETELLAGAVLTELAETARPDASTGNDDAQRPIVIDLCSGSGAISLSVATEFDGVDVLGVEREPAALEWSRENLAHSRLGESTVEFIAGDATQITEERADLRGRADIVVTNPPYVPDAAVPRDPEVAEHDPAAALYGGASGLEILRLIIAEAERLLRPGGLFLMEHSEEQGAEARELLAATASLRHAATFQDYTGRDRYSVARREA